MSLIDIDKVMEHISKLESRIAKLEIYKAIDVKPKVQTKLVQGHVWRYVGSTVPGILSRKEHSYPTTTANASPWSKPNRQCKPEEQAEPPLPKYPNRSLVADCYALGRAIANGDYDGNTSSLGMCLASFARGYSEQTSLRTTETTPTQQGHNQTTNENKNGIFQTNAQDHVQSCDPSTGKFWQ